MEGTIATKVFPRYKAAHRQWRHKGHCAYVHGENWQWEIDFVCTHPDETGFVVDFGSFGEFKAVLDSWFDHTLLIDEDDPGSETFREMEKLGLADVRFVPSCSAEGLAKFVFKLAKEYCLKKYGNRVLVSRVICREDDLNSAIYAG